MHLFSRSVVLRGPGPEIVAAASDLREHASNVIGREIALWSVGLGAPFATMSYTTVVDGLAGAEAMNQQLMTDQGYHDKASALREYMVGDIETNMMRLIHGDITGERPPVGAVATVTTAVAAGSYEEVVGFGVELAQHVESVTGTPIMFGASVAGPFGQFGWIGVSEDAVAADAASEAILSDPGYIKMVSGATGLFVPGHTNRMISTRVA